MNIQLDAEGKNIINATQILKATYKQPFEVTAEPIIADGKKSDISILIGEGRFLIGDKSYSGSLVYCLWEDKK